MSLKPIAAFCIVLDLGVHPLLADSFARFILRLGTDEKILIDILTGRSSSQRQLIAKEYKAATGKVGLRRD